MTASVHTAATLRRARRDRGLSIKRASELIGVNKETLETAEGASREPQPRTMKKIADFYGMRASEIWPVESQETANA